jgi:hypothetical protein
MEVPRALDARVSRILSVSRIVEAAPQNACRMRQCPCRQRQSGRYRLRSDADGHRVGAHAVACGAEGRVGGTYGGRAITRISKSLLWRCPTRSVRTSPSLARSTATPVCCFHRWCARTPRPRSIAGADGIGPIRVSRRRGEAQSPAPSGLASRFRRTRGTPQLLPGPHRWQMPGGWTPVRVP